ncbi:hypothetical protein PoB_007700600 [Plakobranchus ocellatus]|uniref:Uncharacterized protein n=1 Tax=Plakobranchus ocellatus TaxID=259542 RepID=A0AAV4E3R5_9GAST|nr:hypothetical protein PoB_007700600 [Plakobranchus ocellatus]
MLLVFKELTIAHYLVLQGAHERFSSSFSGALVAEWLANYPLDLQGSIYSPLETATNAMPQDSWQHAEEVTGISPVLICKNIILATKRMSYCVAAFGGPCSAVLRAGVRVPPLPPPKEKKISRPNNQGYGGRDSYDNQQWRSGNSGNSMSRSYGRPQQQGSYNSYNRTVGAGGGYDDNSYGRNQGSYSSGRGGYGNRGSSQYQSNDGMYQSYPSNNSRMGGDNAGRGAGSRHQQHHYNPRQYDPSRGRQQQDHGQRDRYRPY